MDPVDLNLLPTLDALLQEESVTRAAHRLGLSTPATSHALSRLRRQLGDPLLVRAGRAMVLTPQALSLRERVRTAATEARAVMLPQGKFSPASLERSFCVHATDHVLTVLGAALDRLIAGEAPRASIQFLPNVADDAVPLREGSIDLAVGIYGDLPPELRTRALFTDRFVCVVREGHPKVGKRLSLDQFLALEHVQIAPRGRPGSYVDEMLAERGRSRRIARAVPYFLAGMLLVAETDYVLTISHRIATSLGPRFGLRLVEPPLSLRPYRLSLLWHPRMDGDAAHTFLRDAFTRAAAETAKDVHLEARTRLGRGARARKQR